MLIPPSGVVGVGRAADDAPFAEGLRPTPARTSGVLGAELTHCSNAQYRDNLRSPLHSASDDWFDLYAVEPGVFALVDSRQQQDVISWLIVGTTRREEQRRHADLRVHLLIDEIDAGQLADVIASTPAWACAVYAPSSRG